MGRESAAHARSSLGDAAFARLAWLSLCIVAPHSIAATLTEVVFREEGFRFGWFYALVEFATYAVCALVHQLWLAGPSGVARIGRAGYRSVAGYLLCGASMTVSHGAGAASLVHLNYTTSMLFKSGKVPSILLGSVALKLHTATMEELLSAILMTTGLFIFGVGEKMEALRFDGIGLILILVNLVGGSATANLQQICLSKAGTCEKLTNGNRNSHLGVTNNVSELLFFQYFAAFVVMFAYCMASGELHAGIAWYASAGWRPWVATVADNLCSYVGLIAIMRITADFDATRANVVCSCRKVITFFASYILFPKPHGVMHVIGLLLTVLGGAKLQAIKLRRFKDCP